MANETRPDGEIELKFSLDDRAAEALRVHLLLAEQDRKLVSQRSIYFDTPDAALRQKGYSLRVRQVGDDFTQTLKTRSGQAGLFDRGEWETPVARLEPDPDALADTPLKKAKAISASFEPVVRCDVERTTWLVDYLDSAIEVVLDTGTVSAGGKRLAFHELELELKRGEPAALFSLARIFLESLPLRLGVLSKQERGEMLAQGLGSAFKAPPLSFDGSMAVGHVFAQILMSCVRHFRLNEYSVLTDCDPAGLHQARVAMRRLRGALSLFRPAIRQPGLARLRDELRWLTGSLADARDLDVFLAEHDLARGDARKLRSAQRAAYDEVRAAIDSQRLRNLLLDLAEWLAIRDWQKREAEDPIAGFAAQRLDRQWKRVKRGASGLARLNDDELHRLRIDVKKLRYAVDFLESLYGKKARKFASRLGRIQDGLGAMNDARIGRQLVASLSLRADPELLFAASRTAQIDALRKDFKALGKVGRFWA